MCKCIFEYQNNNEIKDKLNKILFKCIFSRNGCTKIMHYLSFFKHIDKCGYKVNEYECIVPKFNKYNKSFNSCLYKGKLNEVKNHFKKCAFNKFKYNMCNKIILGINLKKHMIDKCKIRIIDDYFGNKYIGEFKFGVKNGYGIYYYSSGDIYEGEYKDNNKNGYGIYYYSFSGNKYEG